MEEKTHAYQEILVSVEHRVWTVTLNRPEHLNALSRTLKDELQQVLTTAATDPACRVIVLTGAGRAFCAGGDLRNFGDMDVKQARAHMRQIGDIVSLITTMEKPVIAMVNGFATGAGCNLALACDIVFASENARFCQSFVNIGLVPDGGGTYILPRLVGLSQAKDLVFTGRMITAEEAFRLGMVTFMESESQIRESVASYARKLAEGPGTSIGMAKMLLNRSGNLSLDEMIELERFSQTVCMQTEDHREGVRAFREKRRPQFDRS